MMRYICLFVVLVLMCVVNPASVSACSGGAPVLLPQLAGTDIIISGTVLETDSRGYNALLSVNQYFKGSGGQFITVVRWSAALEVAVDVRGYYLGCNGDGGGVRWQTGTTGYFALRSNGDGTFTDIIENTLFADTAQFYPQHGMIEYYQETDSYELRSMSVEDFEAYLLSLQPRTAPLAPDEHDTRYPLKRFLNITTEKGTHYQLNPDRSVIRLDAPDAPLAVSPDGTHVAFSIDDTYIGFQALVLTRLPLHEDIQVDGGWLIPEIGQDVLFAPNSNYALVWDEKQVMVYLFDNHDPFGQGMIIEAIAQADVDWPDGAISRQLVWSADSTTIAYQDKAGIWRWNLFETAEPSLVVPASADVTLLDLSISGRYVRYGTNADWKLLDTHTGNITENSIATPDESNLIYVGAEYPIEATNINRTNCRAPLSETCPILIQQADMQDWFWYKNDQIAIFSCGKKYCYLRSYSWHPGVHERLSDEFEHHVDILFPSVQALAYDALYDQPALVVNGTSLELGLYPHPLRDEDEHLSLQMLEEARDPRLTRFDVVDLSSIIDSPVVKLEWGQPVFYEENAPAMP